MTIAKDDPFFSIPSPPDDWNACIGRQGFDENYIDGYLEAALHLAQNVITNKLYGERDTLVLPILFTTRHAVELALKYLIDRLRAAKVFKAQHRPDHDILSHWKLLCDQELGDEFLRLGITKLEPYIVSLSNIDEDGQSLRYARLRTGERSMEDRSLANIMVIKNSILSLKELLEKLLYRVRVFVDERKTGTFTQKCSRQDLAKIAELLPERSKWGFPEFADAKDAIKKRFNLGNSAFCKALNKIQEVRELKSRIGMNSELQYLSDDHVLLIIQQWRKANPPRAIDPDDLGMDYFNRDFVKMRKSIDTQNKLVSSLEAELSCEEVADLDTIFYVGRDSLFCEGYEDLLERTLKKHSREEDQAQPLRHVITKSSFGTEFANGIERLGRPDLANSARKILA